MSFGGNAALVIRAQAGTLPVLLSFCSDGFR
jgi:hypothetical protein